MDVFHGPADYAEYLRLLGEQAGRHALKVLAYCLMANHVHLVVIPESSESLARGIGETHKRYTRYINFREGVRGFLFQGRFFSCPLDGLHLVAAARYVERNPVRAGVVAEAWLYPWSSAAYHAGVRETDALVSKTNLLELVGECDWKELLRSDPADVGVLRRSTSSGRPYGDEAFLRRAEKLTGRSLVPPPSGRPRKPRG